MPMGDMNTVGGGPQEWFQSLPIITQYWFGITLVLTLAGNFQLVSVWNYVMDWTKITQQFEVWRFLTAFCYAGPFKFDTLMTLYLLVTFSDRYERGGGYNTGSGGGTADYLFMLLFGAFASIATKPIMEFLIPVGVIYTQNMVYMVLYVWSKRFPTAQMNIWGVPVKALYLPFVYVALTLFMGGNYMPIVHGIAMGHLYYFLVDVVPHVYQKDILYTPQFLIERFGVGQYRPGLGTPPPHAGGGGQPAARGRHVWGDSGQRLGGAGEPAARPTRGGMFTGGAGRQQPQQQRQEQAPQNRGGSGGSSSSGHNWGGGGQRLGSS